MLRRILIVMATAALTACGGDGPTSPANQLSGTYNLTQVNGGSLPTTYFQNSAGHVDIFSGTMLLRTDGSYTETRVSRIVYVTGTTENSNTIENGTYSITGSQVTFTIPASGSQGSLFYTGAISGGALTYTYSGVAYRYSK